MKGQSEIAYLPKFADLYVKLKLEFLIASPISYILSFWSLLLLKFWQSYCSSKFWLILGPDDIINGAIHDRL